MPTSHLLPTATHPPARRPRPAPHQASAAPNSPLPQRVWTLGTSLPILASSLTSGLWLQLAFLPHPNRLAQLVALLAASLAFAALFVSVALLAPRFARSPARVSASAPHPARTHKSLIRQLAHCSLASMVLLAFLPEYLARLTPGLPRSLLLAAIAALLYTALCALTLRSRSTQNSASPAPWAAIALSAGFALLTALAIRKYLVFGYVGQDLAYFTQILHTTLHGHLFWGNLLQDLIYTRPVFTDFAGHNSPVMFLYLPFYALFPTPVTLLVLRNLAVLACAFPIYQLARRNISGLVSGPASGPTSGPTSGRISRTAAALWVAVFLCTPAILNQCLFDFYPLSFAALPLLYSLLFYTQHRYTPCCLALFATLLVREDLVFFVFGMGLLALLHRRPWPWTAFPLVVSSAWAALSFLLILPHALAGATFVTDACFAHLGAQPAQMLRNVLLHPQHTVLVHGNLVYLKNLFTGTGFFLSIGSLLSLLSSPYLAINLLAGAGPCITTVLFAQYSVIPATLLFAGALCTATGNHKARPLFRIAHLGLRSPLAAPLFLLSLCLASLVFVTDPSQLDEYRAHPWDAEARRVLSLIPADASLAAPRPLLPHLASRDCLFQAHRLLQYHTPVYEYLLIDTDWSHTNASSIYRAQYSAVARRAAADPHLRTLYRSPQFVLYQNPANHGLPCTPAQP